MAACDICAECFEYIATDPKRGSPTCNHYFHSDCLGGATTCTICCHTPAMPEPAPEEEPEEPEEARTPSRMSWLWTFLMILPLPRHWVAAPTGGGDEAWDASRGIGDWRARMQKIYDAEQNEAGDADDDDDDDDGDIDLSDAPSAPADASTAVETGSEPRSSR